MSWLSNVIFSFFVIKLTKFRFDYCILYRVKEKKRIIANFVVITDKDYNFHLFWMCVYFLVSASFSHSLYFSLKHFRSNNLFHNKAQKLIFSLRKKLRYLILIALKCAHEMDIFQLFINSYQHKIIAHSK